MDLISRMDAPLGAEPSEVDLSGVSVRFEPRTLDVPLLPDVTRLSVRRLQFRWHTVPSPEGAVVTLLSNGDRFRFVRLRLEAEAPFDPKWVVWSFAEQRTPELEGGEAVDAQDLLAPDSSELTLILLPGRPRRVNLEIKPRLTRKVSPGDFPFHVVVEDVGDSTKEAERARLPGMARLRHPASSSLKQLPGIYQDAVAQQHRGQDATYEKPFFERYLRGFDDFLEPLQELLGSLEMFFGAFSAPPDALGWLAGWVCADLDENWPEMKRRALVHEAVEIFRWRGTKRGLSHYLRLYTGVDALIDDQACDGMELGKEAKLGTEATVLGNIPPHTFVVTLAVPNPAEVNEEKVRDIIAYEKPAHTAYTLRLVQSAE